MSTERLTAKDLINKHFYFGVTVEELSKHIEDWNTHQVDHKNKQLHELLKTAEENADWAHDQLQLEQEHRLYLQTTNKQLQEERQNILESLFSIRDMVHGTPWAIVNKLIDQLNNKNENSN